MSKQDFFKTSTLAGKIKLPLKIVVEEKPMKAGELAAVLDNRKYEIRKRVCRLYIGSQCLGEGTIDERDGKPVFKLNKDKQNAKGGR